MPTYKDKTFCSASECKSFNKCHRALTAQIKLEARGIVISQYVSPQELACYKPELKEEDNET